MLLHNSWFAQSRLATLPISKSTTARTRLATGFEVHIWEVHAYLIKVVFLKHITFSIPHSHNVTISN